MLAKRSLLFQWWSNDCLIKNYVEKKKKHMLEWIVHEDVFRGKKIAFPVQLVKNTKIGQIFKTLL